MNIEDNFIQALHEIYANVLGQRRSFKILSNFPVIRTKQEMILARVRSPDKEIARTVEMLKRLPYTTFAVRKSSSNSPFLVGLTQPVCFAGCERNGVNNLEKFGNMGKFAVAVPFDAFITENFNNFHFIPVWNLQTHDRHFHHVASGDFTNPLDAIPSNCWASVGTLMTNAVYLVDVASVFETGFFFLERVDLNSTLARPAYHPVTKAEFARIRQMTMMQVDALIYGEEYNEVVF